MQGLRIYSHMNGNKKFNINSIELLDSAIENSFYEGADFVFDQILKKKDLLL